MANKQGYDCFDTGGEKIRRVGVASLKRIMKDPVCMVDVGPDTWALVSCPDAGVYLSRDENVYAITHMNRDDIIVMDGECKRDEGIKLFLKIRESEMCKGNPEDE